MPLGNVDQSILKIKLDGGFEFDSMTYNEGRNFLSKLEKLPMEIFFNQWRHANNVFPNEGVYFIKKIFEFDLPHKENGDPDFCYELSEFTNSLVEKNIENTLRLLRLFKEGNIYLPCWYVYYVKNGIPSVIYAKGTPYPQNQSLYHLDENEIENAQEFIDSTKIPFSFDYVKLAHDNYEQSYLLHNDSLAFFTLMIALEVLFKPQRRSQFSDMISQNAGIILGHSPEEIEKIQKDISDLYDKRSELVHEGKVIWYAAGEDDDVTRLRRYIRASIKEIISLDLSKDNLLEYLNQPIKKNRVS